MTRTKHKVVFAVCIAIALGFLAILLRPVPAPLLEDVIRNRVGNELGLVAGDTLQVAAQSGDFVRVNLHGVEGSGAWVIVRHTATGTELITKGQDYPTCAPLEAAGVPVELESMCWADDGVTLVERAGR